MIYIVKQSKDPEMYEFWNEYTTVKGKQPMLCFICHSDCMSSGIIDIVKTQGDAAVEFEVIK